MALGQVRLVPVYVRLPFSPGFWGFTFSYAASATDAVLWLRFGRPAGARGLTVAVLALITGFVAVIAYRTVRLALSGRLLLPLAPPPVPPVPPRAAGTTPAAPRTDHPRLAS